jgi:hypothetical protein
MKPLAPCFWSRSNLSRSLSRSELAALTPVT